MKIKMTLMVNDTDKKQLFELSEIMDVSETESNYLDLGSSDALYSWVGDRIKIKSEILREDQNDSKNGI